MAKRKQIQLDTPISDEQIMIVAGEIDKAINKCWDEIFIDKIDENGTIKPEWFKLVDAGLARYISLIRK